MERYHNGYFIGNQLTSLSRLTFDTQPDTDFNMFLLDG